MPVFRGENKFSGPIIHSSDIKTLEQLTAKRAVIIGGGKSAVDLATLAGMHARSRHLIFRRSHWLVPNDLLHGYLLVEYVFSRLFTITYTPYPYAPHSALYPFLHRRCSFILNKIFDSISADIISTYSRDLFDE
jgi:cation diffusion facilitator CzcD-associated flavoprotein CzcO